ncbi:MAG: hypothetical protein M3Q91_02620 [Acidobacteriota bacterium]|nr:hypothetical protein [Acidobacteriota bacterium]
MMARSYYSTLFEQTADEGWAIVRDFNNYPRYIEGITESVDRSFTYAGRDRFYFPAKEGSRRPGPLSLTRARCGPRRSSMATARSLNGL